MKQNMFSFHKSVECALFLLSILNCPFLLSDSNSVTKMEVLVTNNSNNKMAKEINKISSNLYRTTFFSLRFVTHARFLNRIWHRLYFVLSQMSFDDTNPNFLNGTHILLLNINRSSIFSSLICRTAINDSSSQSWCLIVYDLFKNGINKMPRFIAVLRIYVRVIRFRCKFRMRSHLLRACSK